MLNKEKEELEILKSEIEKSNLFNKVFYLRTYQDIRVSDMNAIDHFVKHGLQEDRKPNVEFDPSWYREFYNDVKEAGEYPFIHYIIFGKEENRFQNEAEKNKFESSQKDNINIPYEAKEELHDQELKLEKKAILYFDGKAYLEASPDVEDAIEKGEINDVEHHLAIAGLEEIKKGDRLFHKGFEPFDEAVFIKVYPEVEALLKGEKFTSVFDYFCKVGYHKIINGDIPWNIEGTPYVIPEAKKITKLLGSIGEYENGRIRGWCYSTEKFKPLVLINGRPCKIIKSNIPMQRVAINNNLDRDDVGFIAEVTGNISEANNISLYSLSDNRCTKITSTKKFMINNLYPRSLSVFNDLKEISLKKNAVAIVVWDVTHNPIGRAKVLYDIVKEKHPVIMIGFDFGFSKSEVWEPIASSDIKLLSIKWDERELYNHIMEDFNISFDTVWICKPRLPSFVLADMFSNEKTKFILDIDDNESEMSQSNASLPKPYGSLGNHLAESITKNIDAKSVASVSIKEHWGGEFVRHARMDIDPKKIKERRKLPEKIKIGFFGTIRPHKNIHKAAEMIKKIQIDLGIDLEFNVGGHFYPDELRKTIESFDAKTYGMIPNSILINLLNDMDILMTGFPLDSDECEITKYQISSKIGDALSAGRPVLVPEGSSVNDLVDIPGIYLFNENNFSDKLLAAINHKGIVELPSLFSLSDNYNMFMKLQKLASKKKKTDIFKIPLLPYLPKENNISYKPTLVLLWKQPDSTMYGRRVDQLARSYKRKFPDHRVVLLETINKGQEINYMSQSNDYVGDSSLIVERLREKRMTLELEGIEHIVLEDNIFQKKDYFRSFLLSNRILPLNTLFVLFPMIGYFETFFSIIEGYRYIADIVDNQLGWKSKHPEEIVQQYKVLSENAEYVIFNSENNHQFFIDHGFIGKKDNHIVITNWYELPKILKKNIEINKEKKIFYSGNMNDRIDWNLIEKVLEILPDDITLYLIGNAQRSAEKIRDILSRHQNCQFLGPIDERNLIDFIQNSLFSIMPHTVESTSQYMNPLKIHMFASLGIKCISTDVPGLEKRFSNLLIAKDEKDFIHQCVDNIEMIKIPLQGVEQEDESLLEVFKESRDVYMSIISDLLSYEGKL